MKTNSKGKGHRLLDLSGKRFGRLVAVRISHRKNKCVYWLFACDCGNEKAIRSDGVTGGIVLSCGCLGKEKRTEANQTHGESDGPEFSALKAAKQRCYNPKYKKFHLYGGRGIKVCERWRDSYEAFINDMGKRPDGFSLDRINSNGDYEPSNCRWADIRTQNNNLRSNHILTLNGASKTLTQWQRELGFSRGIIDRRLKMGWTVERSLTTKQG